MEKKYKYKYWHIITHVNKEYQKFEPKIKVGLGVGRKDKHPYDVDVVDMNNGKIYNNAYTLDYIGRLPSDAPIEEVKKLFDKKK